MIEEIILKEAVGAVKHALQVWSSRRQGQASVELKSGEEALKRHLKLVENWSCQVTLKDSPRTRYLSQIAVKIKLSEGANRNLVGDIDPEHLLVSGLNSVLLGDPGAGKTTLIKSLCQRLLHAPSEDRDAFAFPIRVLLCDLRADERLVDHLLGILGIEVRKHVGQEDHLREENEEEEDRYEEENVLGEYLDASNAILLLDGLDEMKPEHGLRVQREIRRLANILNTSKFVLTCRTGSLHVPVDNSEVLHVCPFGDEQVRAFASRWLGLEAMGSFLATVDRSPYRDTIGRPLILVNLCMVYQSYGELPDQPMLIYQKVIQLLLEGWDRQRDLRRVSSYGRFGPERKQQFLGALAYRLAVKYGTGPRYSGKEVRAAYREVHESYGLPLQELDRVIEEIESHTGLLLSLGLGKFEFSHKSLQEYLCAEHISRLPNLKPHLRYLVGLPSECAIATVLSASPNELFEVLAFNFMSGIDISDVFGHQVAVFWNPYLTRLGVEGASFSFGEQFGFAVFVLASFAWQPWGKESAQVYMSKGGELLADLVEKLLAQESVAKSVVRASAAFSVSWVGEECVEIQMSSPPRCALPCKLGKLFIHRILCERMGISL